MIGALWCQFSRCKVTGMITKWLSFSGLNWRSSSSREKHWCVQTPFKKRKDVYLRIWSVCRSRVSDSCPTHHKLSESGQRGQRSLITPPQLVRGIDERWSMLLGMLQPNPMLLRKCRGAIRYTHYSQVRRNKLQKPRGNASQQFGWNSFLWDCHFLFRLCAMISFGVWGLKCEPGEQKHFVPAI